MSKIFRQKHDNFLARSPEKYTMLKFYTPFSDILLKIIKLSRISQKNKYQNTVLLKMFSMTVRTHFWHHSGMSLPNFIRNFAQLPEKNSVFFPLIKDCSNCFWTRSMQIWQLGLKLFAEAQNVLARKQKKSKPQVLRWKSFFTLIFGHVNCTYAPVFKEI